MLSANPETGEIAYKTVEETYINETDELIHVHVNGEIISATPNHPFYVDKFGWILAKNLRAGDILVLSNGEFVVVEWVQHEILENPIKVYNFEVADFHTYYVADSNILVHNVYDGDKIRWRGFSSEKHKKSGLKQLTHHYQKHVINNGEFGGASKISQNDYLKLAKNFAANTSENIQRATIGSFYIKYDPNSQYTFIGNIKQRQIRTFYQANLSIASDPFLAAQQYARGLMNGTKTKNKGKCN